VPAVPEAERGVRQAAEVRTVVQPAAAAQADARPVAGPEGLAALRPAAAGPAASRQAAAFPALLAASAYPCLRAPVRALARRRRAIAQMWARGW